LGQCNNSGSAVKIATALAEAFNCSVNDLPLSIVLSWFEQKAVAILLGLLHLGVKNIYIGPKAPEWFTSNIVEVLQKNFDLQLISGDAKADLEKMLG
jgi:hydroxylamine reductase